MAKREIHPVLLFLFTISTVFSFGQTLSIDYNNPSVLQICDGESFEVTLRSNNQPVTDLSVTIVFPKGIDYLAGSVANGMEENISNLNQPVFSFPNLAANDEHTISLRGEVDCSIINDINGGKVFANTIAANFDGGTEQVITLPYLVETGFLVMTEIEPLNASGQFADEVIRRITVKNTRLAPINEFLFRDRNEGFIEISSNGNNPQTDPDNTYQATFDASHFSTIGNFDEKFDEGEEFVIEERIIIGDCGEEIFLSNSYLTVSWGCNNEICQSSTRPANTIFEAFRKFSEVTFQTAFHIEDDFCITDLYEQSIFATNEGNNIIENLQVNIKDKDPVPSSSITNSINGTPLTPDIILDEIFDNTPACSFPNNVLYTSFSTIIPRLEPGETAEIRWQSFICDNFCGDEIPTLSYSYKYDQHCLEPEINDNFKQVISDVATSILRDSISSDTIENMDFIVDDGKYKLRYDLFSEVISDTTGLIDIVLTFPCGFTWSNTPLILDGKNPITTNITNSQFGQAINLQYELPFSSNHVWGDFCVDFVLDENCFPLDTISAVPVKTSCSSIFVCGSGTEGMSGVNSGTPVVINPNADSSVVQSFVEFRLGISSETNYLPPGGNQSCNSTSCKELRFKVGCDKPSILDDPDLISGYLEFSSNFERLTLGYQDDQDDREIDSFDPPNLDLIRRDRVMTGDTAMASASGVVVTDEDQYTYGKVRFQIEFEGHTVDDGLDGGSGIDIINDTLLFQSFQGIKPLLSRVRVKDFETQAEYFCEVPARTQANGFYKIIPIQRKIKRSEDDQTLEIAYLWEVDLENAFQLGSNFPEGFVLTEGDSIFLETDFYFDYNPGAKVLNLRTEIRTNLFNDAESTSYCTSCGSEEKNFQLSGYEVLSSIGNFDYDPCVPFNKNVGSIFRISLGMPNFFPFEIRPLMQVDEWTLDLAGTFDLVRSEIVNMGLVGGGSAFSDVPITPQKNGNLFIHKLLPFQEPIFDEGFFYNLFHEFVANPEICTSQEATDLKVYVKNKLIADFQEINIIDTVESSRGFVPLIPKLRVSSLEPNTFTTTQKTDWDLTIENRNEDSGGNNLWLHLSSPSGRLFNLILNNVNGQEITPTNDIYQLGNIAPEEIISLQILSDVSSCGLDSLQVLYGWNCEPLGSINAFTCLKDTVFLYVTAPLPELEMVITSPLDSVLLCDTIPYHTIEIFNADLGTAFDLVLEVLMPLGMNILPGSSQIAYTSSSGNFQNIPDPIDLGNGNYSWNINDIQNIIRDNGLPGAANDPDNSFSIRFLGMADCGALASTPPFFTIAGINTCSLPSNTLTNPGERINIEGVTSSYLSLITSNRDAITNCGDELELEINIQASGITEIGDSVFITLPRGVSYIPNSYRNIQNASSIEPVVQQRGNFTLLKWPLVPGLQIASFIRFSFSTLGYSNSTCADEEILIQTIQTQEALCQSTNELCPVFIETGNANIPVDIRYPEWSFTTFNASLGSNGVDFEINGLNSGFLSSHPFLINFYIDEDGNGIVSSDDIFIGEQLINSTSILNNIFSVNGNLNISSEDLCKIIAVIPSENECNCSVDIIRINSETVVNQTIQTCNGEIINLGVDGIAGANYFWSNPQNLSCTDCPMTELTAINFSDSTQVFRYILIEEGTDCPKEYIYDVEISSDLKIINTDKTICEGEEITLEVNSNIPVIWNGPGITDPNLQRQVVMPSLNSVYTVSVNNGNCNNTDSIKIEVLPAPIAEAGDDASFCDSPGTNVQLNANFNSDYSYFWEPSHLLNDFLIHNPTILINQSSTLKLTVTNQLNGCSATDSVQVFFEESPDLVVSNDVAICQGESATLTANGAINYNWTPFSTLNCIDATCQTVVANPSTTTIYYVTGTSTGGCESLDSITVFVQGELEFTNEIISSCSGKTVEIGGVSYDQNDTIVQVFPSLATGCDSTHTIYLEFFQLFSEVDLSSCEGDSILIGGVSYFENDTIDINSGNGPDECDTLITYFLNFTPSFSSLDTTICFRDSILINDTIRYESGIFSDLIEINGCQTEIITNLTVLPFQEIEVDTFYEKILKGDSVQILDIPSGFSSYQWFPSTSLDCDTCRTVWAKPEETQQYTVTLFDNNGCSIEIRGTVEVFQTCSEENIKMPNIFSPNNDGRNDLFCRIDNGIEEIASIKIFNRWGQKVYEGSGPNSKWDGTFNGENQPPEVYVYMIEATCPDEKQKKVGDITLIR